MERKSVGFEQLSDIFGFRVLVKHDRGLLPGARHRAYDLADGADAVQGLHLDPEAERLSLAPHHRDRPRASSASSCRSAPARCTRSPNTASRRTRFTRTGRLAFRNAVARDPTPMRGCARRSSCWPRGRTRRNSSSTPSSSCSMTRCSASRRRARLIALPRKATAIDFAYAVHTDVGNTAVGAKINGKIAPLVSELSERRRGRDHHLEGADRAAGGVGVRRRHRQGARGDPARDARCGAHAICRPRPPHRRAAVPARQEGIFRREAAGRAAAPGAFLDRRGDGGGRARRDEGLRRRARDVSRLQGGARCARRQRRRPRAAGSG